MTFDRRFAFSAVLGVLLFAAAGLSAVVLDNYQLQVFTTLAMLCALCWAWNIVGGYMGYPSLATAAFFGVGAYAGGIAQMAGVPIGLAWLCSGLAGAVLAVLLGAACCACAATTSRSARSPSSKCAAKCRTTGRT